MKTVLPSASLQNTRPVWTTRPGGKQSVVRFSIMTPPTSAGPRFLTLSQVAEELSVTHSQVYALVRSGDLGGIQIGGRNQWRVERSKLDRYIDQAYRRAAQSSRSLPAELPDDG